MSPTWQEGQRSDDAQRADRKAALKPARRAEGLGLRIVETLQEALIGAKAKGVARASPLRANVAIRGYWP